MMKYTNPSTYFTGASGKLRSRRERFPDFTSDVQDMYFTGANSDGKQYVLVIHGELNIRKY